VWQVVGGDGACGAGLMVCGLWGLVKIKYDFAARSLALAPFDCAQDKKRGSRFD
jgi:hypothetical protein